MTTEKKGSKSNLELFWKLSEKNDGVRIDAAFKLISHLNRQKDDPDFKKNLKYCLQRFVAGLASAKTTSRRGFFVGLVEYLKTFHKEVSIQDCLEMMNKCLNVKGSKSVS